MELTKTVTKTLKVADLHPNEGQMESIGVHANPRIISEGDYRLLVESMRTKNMTGVLPLKVFNFNGEWVVLGGNMRLRAMQELHIDEVSCIVVPEDADAETLNEIIIKDNSTLGDWDMDALSNWNEPLSDWGVDVPEFEESDEDEIARKEAEFRERMAAGEISEEDEEYQEFLEKFKLKKTTDDCYTPQVVYEAVAKYVEKTYNVSRKNFVRPFYPNGDYKNEKYPKGCVVVDNPPFSILAEILQFYKNRGIAFFLFAPTLTLFSSSSSSSCALPCGVAITYANGASVNTSFLTSFEAGVKRLKSAPELYAAVKNANDENLKELHKELPKYTYPLELVTSTKVAQYSRLGIEFSVPYSESEPVSRLDMQKDKAIYGKGYLVSLTVVAERERAERERAERERAERERAERFELSEREKEIVRHLTPNT